jgi:hypothetical protein
MHAALYVCLACSKARSSFQARKKTRAYLRHEGFDRRLRFSGCCDYFKIGGCWSGQLTLLRLRDECPRQFDRFWSQYRAATSPARATRLFQETFPLFGQKLPIQRRHVGPYGEADDAHIMDGQLFHQLKPGFSEDVCYSYTLAKPNVIFTDDPDDDFAWPKTDREASKFWVVIIDYHF